MNVKVVTALATLVAAAAFLFEAYEYLLWKGVWVTFLGLSALAVAIFILPKLPGRTDNSQEPKNVWTRHPWMASGPFWWPAAVFLLIFPYSDLFRAVGLLPGLAFIGILALLVHGLRSTASEVKESKEGSNSIAVVSAVIVWCVVVWLWAEAGKEGFVVLPMDVPAGAEVENEQSSPALGGSERIAATPNVEFTGEGMADALETEIETIENGEQHTYADSEAAQIIAPDLIHRLFPANSWYLSSSSHSPQLNGLDTSHLISKTQVRELPLNSIYHLLRHIRGKPLIEGQVLIGSDSVTVALRRAEYQPSCLSDDLTDRVISKLEQVSDDKLLTIDELDRFIRSYPTQTEPDTDECHPGLLWQILSALDLLPAREPGPEERVANVTVGAAKGDVQITEALHFATLEAMGSLSAERLALYYDRSYKSESALKLFERALPAMILEYNSAPPARRPAVRERLIEALIRIGDFEEELHPADPKSRKISIGAYSLAKELGRGDPQVTARIAYHYLVLSEFLSVEAAEVKPKNACQEQSKETASHFREMAVNTLRDGDVEKPIAYQIASARYGESHARETLAWMNANYAYAMALTPIQNRTSEAALACALFYGNPATEGWCRNEDASIWELMSSVHLASIASTLNKRPSTLVNTPLAANRDLRAEAATAFVWSLRCVDKKQQEKDTKSTIALCNIKPEDIKSVTEKLLKSEPPYTLNTSIILEDQLSKFYSSIPDTRAAGEINGKLLHQVWMYLLTALKEYRAGMYDHALRSVELASQFTSGKVQEPNMTRLLALAHAFVASTYQEQPGPMCGVDDRGEIAVAANDDLAKAQQEKDELYWRASSLNAVRHVMCLDHGRPMVCDISPKEAANYYGMAKAASDAMPDNAYLHANVGITLVRFGYKSEFVKNIEPLSDAPKEFREAVEINQGDPWLRCLLSFALRRNGEVEEANSQAQFGRLLDPARWTGYERTLQGVWPALMQAPKEPVAPPVESGNGQLLTWRTHAGG